MGQISLPVLNRTGYSTFWQSVWDDKHNFNRGLKEDILIRTIIPYIFFDRISKQQQFLSFSVVNESVVLKEFVCWPDYATPDMVYTKLKQFFFKKTKIPYYILKIWILKFQTWVLIYFNLYSPLKATFIFSKKPKKYNITNHIGYYHLFLSSLKFSKNYLSNINYIKNNF